MYFKIKNTQSLLTLIRITTNADILQRFGPEVFSTIWTL